MRKKVFGTIITGIAAAILLMGTPGSEKGAGMIVQASEALETEDETSAEKTEETVYPLTVTDDLGIEITIEEEPQRVVSLSPSNTEILYAIGAGDRVVGRTDYCNYPEEVLEVESIGSYYSPNTELILSVSADIVFASDYMDDSIREQLEDNGVKVVIFSAVDVESVENDIILAGQILNCAEGAAQVTEEMESEMEELQEILADKTETKSVFIDIGSFYSAGPGSLLDSMLTDIGAENIVSDTGETWPQLSVETIIEKNPDIYVSLYTTPEELKEISGFEALDCIVNDQIVYFDGSSEEGDIIQRAGPRLVEGTRLMAEQIYPELFE